MKLAYSQEDQPAFCHALKAHTAEADPRNAAVVISKTIGSIRRGARLTDRPLSDPPARRPPAGTAQLNADVSNSSVYPQDRYDRDRDWARADFDVRHVLSPNFVWNLPRETDRGWLGGWQVNGIVTLRSGVPFTPALGLTNWSRSGNTSGEDRPNLRPGVNPEDLILGRPDQYYDPSGFVLQPAGFLGNAGRNRLTGPNYAMTNLSLVKNTKLGLLGGGGQVQVRLEVFNVLNHTNFATPDRTVFAAASEGEPPLPTAGRITRTVTTSRQIQLGLKVIF